MKNTLTLISIYITSNNYGKYLKKAIDSVLNQSYKNWELFLINDCSKDNTKKIINKYKKNRKIKIIHKKTFCGLQKIANEIIYKCKGDYLLRLDADDWLHNTALEIMSNRVSKSKDCQLLIPGYFYVNEKSEVLGYENNFKSILNKNHIAFHGACTLFKTTLLKKVGGYSENINAQDGLDIWYKVKNKVKFDVIDLPLFFYRKYGESLSNNNIRILNAKSDILNNQSNIKLKNKLKILSILPVKKDYIKNKNLPFKKIKGKTLLEHSINSSLNSKLITHTLVSTSSSKVINFCKKKFSSFNITFYKRPKNFDKSLKKFSDILTSSLKYFEKKTLIKPDLIVYINTHVIRSDVKHIDDAIKTLVLRKFNTVFSVNKIIDPIFKIQSNDFLLLNKGRFDNLDYNNESYYISDNSIVVSNYNSVKNKSIFKKNFGFVETNSNKLKKII